MSTQDNGGPAFPIHPDMPLPNGEGITPIGLSVRDYMAAKALQGFCANPSVFAGNPRTGWGPVNCTEEQLGRYAYEIADAMLKARSQP